MDLVLAAGAGFALAAPARSAGISDRRTRRPYHRGIDLLSSSAWPFQSLGYLAFRHPTALIVKRRGESSSRAVAPGDGLVVGRCGGEAAVEDADEAVAEGAEGGVVGVAGGPSVVVEGPGSG